MADNDQPRTDAERANSLRERVRSHLEVVCSIMDEARASGLVLNFAIGTSPHGKSSIQDISVVRPL